MLNKNNNQNKLSSFSPPVTVISNGIGQHPSRLPPTNMYGVTRIRVADAMI